MENYYKIALEQALTWINSNYRSTGIIVGGSIMRGNPNKNSDFDIFVIHDDFFRQRVQRIFNSVPCEIFVNSIEHIYKYFEKELANNRPVCANLLATGQLYKGSDNQKILTLIEEAKKYAVLSIPLTDEQLIFRKYTIANLLEDVADLYVIDKTTALFILDKIVIDIIDFMFLCHQQPLPRVKDRINALLELDYQTGQAIKKYYSETSIAQKYELAKQMVLHLTGTTGFFEWSSTPE